MLSIKKTLIKLLNSTLTAPSITSGRATNVVGGYAKVGPLVIVQLQFNAAINISTNDYFTMFSGLPTPQNSAVIALYASGVANSGATSGMALDATLKSSGEIVLQTTSKAVSSGSTYCISGVYLGGGYLISLIMSTFSRLSGRWWAVC